MKMNVCIKGVGCDTVSIPRFEEKMNNTRLVDKLFTEYEQNYIADKQIPSAAGIWAAKEDASKSLGTGFYGFTIKDIEVRHTAQGQPQIILYNGALKQAEKLGVKRIHISISHESEQALAFAVAE